MLCEPWLTSLARAGNLPWCDANPTAIGLGQTRNASTTTTAQMRSVLPRPNELSLRTAIQKLDKSIFYCGPFCGDDGIAEGIARNKIRGHSVGTKNAFELRANALGRGL